MGRSISREDQREAFRIAEVCLGLSPEYRDSLLGGEEISDEIREEVCAILSACDRSDKFMDAPLAGVELADDFWNEEPPSQIDDYEILDLLGEGGMGRVYLARQLQPIKRKVALKTLKWGMDTREILSRFSVEYRTLAAMAHPNLAFVFDAGEWKGRPYFTMEYFPGKPLERFTSDLSLSLDDKFELFLQACAGVSHAHRYGVIHRDLKPGNLLARQTEAGPVLKVIDFGIAKIIDRSWINDFSFQTEAHNFLGTPAYMSPEQIDTRTYQVDVRTDVYGLGAVLYYLLTGSAPFDPAELASVSLLEMMEIICYRDPTPPGLRLAAAGNRKGLPVELDWITMKALARDPNDRYGSVTELVEDLRRFREGRPVMAGPPSVIYKIKKFLLRHQIGALTIFLAVVALALIARSYNQAQQARIQMKNADDIAGVITSLLNDAMDIPNPNRLRNPSQIKALIQSTADQALPRLEAFPRKQAQLLTTLARTFSSLGDYHQAITYAENALDLSCKLDGIDSEGALVQMDRVAFYYFQAGETQTSLDQYRETLERLERSLGPTHPQFALTQRGQANVLRQLDHLDEAEKLYHQSLALQQHLLPGDDAQVLITTKALGNVLLYKGRFQEALSLYQYTWEGLALVYDSTHPETLSAHHNMALALARLGNTREAVEILETVLEQRTETLGIIHPDTLNTRSMLGRIYYDQGHLDKALQHLKETYELQKIFSGNKHNNTLETGSNLALAIGDSGDAQSAVDLLGEVWQIRQLALGPAHSDTLKTANNMANYLLGLGATDEAESILRESLALLEASGRSPTPNDLIARATLSEVLIGSNRYSEARIQLELLLHQARTVYPPKHLYLAIFQGLLGITLNRLMDYQQAEEHLLASSYLYGSRKGPYKKEVLAALAEVERELCR